MTQTRSWLTTASIMLPCCIALSLCLARGAAAQVSVSGPVPGMPVLGTGTPVEGLGQFGNADLAANGYVTEEFFLSGTAVSYKAVRPLTAAGNWQVAPAESAPFKTRLIVIRPTDPGKFNGTVVVEWLNVSLGADTAPDWYAAHRELTRSGFAYVGVSVQKVGIEGGPSNGPPGTLALKKADPTRYSSLSHPGDAFAYDIYSQAGRTVRNAGSSGVMGPLIAKHVLGAGESQSAIFLTTYVNAVDPIAGVYDGYLIHSRFGFAAAFDGSSVYLGPGREMPVVTRLRSDLRVPVITIITETDLVGYRYLNARQPDNRRLRVWEIAGTAHSDTYNLRVAAIDSNSATAAQLAAAYSATAFNIGPMQLPQPINSAPQHHYVVMAALRELDRWVTQGIPPPRAPRLKAVASDKPDGMPQLVLDANGNARGGIRTPWVDVPLARLSGVALGDPERGGAMFGVTELFDQATLAALYPGGKAEYLKTFDKSLDSAIQAGFILRTDAPEIRSLAAAMYPGTR